MEPQVARRERSNSDNCHDKTRTRTNSTKSLEKKKERPVSTKSAKRTDVNDDVPVQHQNKAVSLRTTHLHWLIDNNVYSKGINDYQDNLRQHSPSHSARYPMRMSKDQIDPEWVQSDYRVHIFHCQRDALWVNQWIRGILEARRYQVTTNSQPFGDCDRVIIVLSQNMAKAPANVRKAADGIRGRISLGIKKEHCIEPNEIKDRCLGYIDMSRVSMYDYTFQYHLMKNVIKCLFLPEPIGSA